MDMWESPDRMGSGAILSGLLHLAVILIIILGPPWWYEPTEIMEATPVGVVSAEQLAALQKSRRAPAQKQPETPKETAIPEAPKAPELPEPEPEPQPAPAPEPQARPEPSPEPAPAVEPQPEPEPEPAPQQAPRAETEQQPVIAPPEPPKVEREPQPPVPPEQLAKAEPKPLPPRKPQPPKRKAEEKPKEKPTQQAAAEPDFASALIDKLSKRSKKAASRPQQTQDAALPPDDYDGPPLTEGEKDMIRRQVEGNWIVDVGMAGLAEMTVEVNVQMNPDGTVQSAKFDPSDNNGDPNWVIFAESCRRAVLKSSPLRMPPDKPYPAWAKMTLVFNAKQMLGL